MPPTGPPKRHGSTRSPVHSASASALRWMFESPARSPTRGRCTSRHPRSEPIQHVNADTATQLRLLELQAHDTALSQLAHRRRTLPELTAIATHAKEAADLQNDVVDAQTRLSD